MGGRCRVNKGRVNNQGKRKAVNVFRIRFEFAVKSAYQNKRNDEANRNQRLPYNEGWMISRA